ncbi:MAG: hypothetical protein FJW50_00820 [Actinobacteria bacterium]|nr:hypothetical protein [Actinomycetota bacterium]
MTLKVRNRVVAALLVVATVLAPAGVTAFWAQQTITNPEKYVQTVTNVFTAQNVRDNISQAVAETVAESTMVEEGIAKLLPDNLSVLSPLLTSALGNLAGDLTKKALGSQAADAIARVIAVQSHKALMAVLTGQIDENSPFLVNGDLVLDLTVLADDVVTQVGERNETLGKVLQEVVAKVPPILLLEGEQITALRAVYNAANPFLIVLLPFTIALYVIAVVISRRREQTLMQAGATFAGSQMLLALGLWWVKDSYLANLTGAVFGPAVSAIFDQLLTYLWQSILISVLIGAIAFTVGLIYTLKRNSTTSSGRI